MCPLWDCLLWASGGPRAPPFSRTGSSAKRYKERRDKLREKIQGKKRDLRRPRPEAWRIYFLSVYGNEHRGLWSHMLPDSAATGSCAHRSLDDVLDDFIEEHSQCYEFRDAQAGPLVDVHPSNMGHHPGHYSSGVPRHESWPLHGAMNQSPNRLSKVSF